MQSSGRQLVLLNNRRKDIGNSTYDLNSNKLNIYVSIPRVLAFYQLYDLGKLFLSEITHIIKNYHFFSRRSSLSQATDFIFKPWSSAAMWNCYTQWLQWTQIKFYTFNVFDTILHRWFSSYFYSLSTTTNVHSMVFTSIYLWPSLSTNKEKKMWARSLWFS